MPPTLEQIDQILKSIESASDIKAVLAILVAGKILDFAGAGLGRIKKAIQDKQNNSKYAFVPNREEARQLQQLNKNPDYKQVEAIVPKSHYIDIIRTGLLVDLYLRRNTIQDRQRIKEIKMEICTKPNGKKLLKVVNLPSMPVFGTMLRYIYELKMEGYPDSYLEEEFDSLVLKWEEATIFVKNEHTPKEIVEFLQERITHGDTPIFAVAMLNAIQNLDAALDSLRKENVLSRNNYTIKITTLVEGRNPRKEVIIDRKEMPEKKP